MHQKQKCMAMDGDGELLARWQSGDASSGEKLLQRYYRPIERFFRGKVSSGVGDLVQETFVACIESRHCLSDGHKFRSYLFSIAYNVLHKGLRQRYLPEVGLDDACLSLPDSVPQPEVTLSAQRVQRRLHEGLRRIPAHYREALTRHYWHHQTTAEMARSMQLPVGTVRSRLRRARELLALALHRLECSGWQRGAKNRHFQ